MAGSRRLSESRGSEDGREEQRSATLPPEWARERADGEWYGPLAAGRSSRQAKPEAAPKLIVAIPFEGEDEWVKARVLDNQGQAAALMETLMDGGLAPERMSIFSATQLAVDVAYRPVVELSERQGQDKSPGTG